MQDLSKWTVMPGITRRVSISSFQCSRTFLNIPISGSQGVVSVWWMNLITQSELQGCQSQVSDWSRPGGAGLSLVGTSKGSDLSQSDLTHLGIVSPLSPILNVSQLSFFLPFCLFFDFQCWKHKITTEVCHRIRVSLSSLYLNTASLAQDNSSHKQQTNATAGLYSD